MPRRQYVGGAVATKLNGPVTNATTAIAVLDASTYPSGATAFVIAIDRGLATEEKVLCVRTGGSNTLTATTRGFDGTSAVAHVDAAVVEHVLDAATIDEVNLFANTMTTNGDLLSRTAGAPSRLAIGNTGQQLGIASALPSWQPGYSVWATTTARDAGITVPGLGMLALTTDTGTLWRYNGTAWVQHAVFVVCTSSTRPTGFESLMIYETDTDRLMQHNSTGWVIISEPTQTYTPTVTNATLGTGGTVTGTFHRSDGWIDLTILLTFGTSPTVNGNIIFSLPTATVVIQPVTIFELMKGNVIVNDATGNRWYGHTYHDGFNSVGCAYDYTVATSGGSSPGVSAAALGATAPFTWASGDFLLAWVRFQMSNRHSFT